MISKDVALKFFKHCFLCFRKARPSLICVYPSVSFYRKSSSKFFQSLKSEKGELISGLISFFSFLSSTDFYELFRSCKVFRKSLEPKRKELIKNTHTRWVQTRTTLLHTHTQKDTQTAHTAAN